jgi:hypothetical protein
MRTFREFVEDTELEVPQYLYHATYKPLLDSIKENGLNTSLGKKTYPDSVKGVIYLAKEKDVAESYAETSDVVDEDWLEQIIILKINTKKLNKNYFYTDKNVKHNKGDTLEYHGTIPFKYIEVIK